jgi:hypothetical protein
MYHFYRDRKSFSVKNLLKAASELNCLLTGKTQDAVIVPVSGNMNNILLTNMAVLHGDLLHNSKVIRYNAVINGWTVGFRVLDCLVDYNTTVLESAGHLISVANIGPYEYWGELALRHIKGIETLISPSGISINFEDVLMYIEAPNAAQGVYVPCFGLN